MLFTEDPGHGQYQIKAYRPGNITINDRDYQHSLILSAHKLIENWQPPAISQLTLDDLTEVMALTPEIILLGTGQSFIIPPASFLAAVRAQRLGIEFMDTAAACRTFIALTAEDRKVVAALII